MTSSSDFPTAMTLPKLPMALPLILLCVSMAANSQKSGISFYRGNWAVTCDNTLTCRMEGYNNEETKPVDERGSVLITRAAGPNAPLHGEVTLAAWGSKTDYSWPFPPSLTLWVDGKNNGHLKRPNKKAETYPLTQNQVRVLLEAAKSDKTVEFRGGKRSFVLSGDGISAAMLKMDDVQGRGGTPGALIRKGSKPEKSVLAPVPKPIIRAAKVSDKPSRELTEREARTIKPLLWKSRDETCELHNPEREYGEKPKFTLTPLNEQYTLISSLCEIFGYHESVAYWMIDSKLKSAPKFLMENAYLEYSEGTLTTTAMGRGLGDCLSGASWVWDGTEFRLSYKWTTGLCRFIRAGGTWSIPTYVTEVIPAK